jgi:hypothetical protein
MAAIKHRKKDMSVDEIIGEIIKEEGEEKKYKVKQYIKYLYRELSTNHKDLKRQDEVRSEINALRAMDVNQVLLTDGFKRWSRKVVLCFV